MMRIKAKRKKHKNTIDSDKANVHDNEPSQSTSVAIGILMLIVAGGCFVCAYAYLTAGGTSCHLDGIIYRRISHLFVNAFLRGVCSIFETSVSDKNKPIVGSTFFVVMGLIALVISWRSFASINDNSKDYSKL